MHYISVEAATIFAAFAFAIFRLLKIATRYRKVDRIEVFRLGTDVMPAWFRRAIKCGDVIDADEWSPEESAVLIRSPEGWCRADIGDWIGKRPDGTICLCQATAFENASEAA